MCQKIFVKVLRQAKNVGAYASHVPTPIKISVSFNIIKRECQNKSHTFFFFNSTQRYLLLVSFTLMSFLATLVNKALGNISIYKDRHPRFQKGFYRLIHQTKGLFSYSERGDNNGLKSRDFPYYK